MEMEYLHRVDLSKLITLNIQHIIISMSITINAVRFFLCLSVQLCRISGELLRLLMYTMYSVLHTFEILVFEVVV